MVSGGGHGARAKVAEGGEPQSKVSRCIRDAGGSRALLRDIGVPDIPRYVGVSSRSLLQSITSGFEIVCCVMILVKRSFFVRTGGTKYEFCN